MSNLEIVFTILSKIAFQYSTWIIVFPRLGFTFYLDNNDCTILLVL